MGSKQQGQSIAIAYKKQAGLGQIATGAGATGIEVRPSAGIGMTSAQIQSAMFRRNKMKLRSRNGSNTASAAYETELQVGMLDGIFEALLGCVTPTPVVAIAPGVTGTVAVTSNPAGDTITATTGDFVAQGLKPGLVIRLTGSGTAGNNGKVVPVLAVAPLQLTVPTGMLVAAPADGTTTITTGKSYSTPTPYVEQYYTWEERLVDLAIPVSKVLEDAKVTTMQVTANPDEMVLVSWGLTGLEMKAPTAQQFPAPQYNTQPNVSSLVMLDGFVTRNGVKMLDLTGAQFGLTAPGTLVPVLGSRRSPDVFLGSFDFSGQFTQLIEDDATLKMFLAEDQFAVSLMCVENDPASPDFVNFYMGNLSYGGWSAPIADGAMTQTLTLNGGSDTRAGHADTVMIISTSSAV